MGYAESNAQLLGVGVPAISKHPTRISEGGGLDKVVVVPNSQNIFVSSRLVYNNVWTNKET